MASKKLIALATLGLEFDGDAIETRSLGGSETAFIYMARELAALGNEVHAFCLTKRPGIYSGVTWHKVDELDKFQKSNEIDVMIVSRVTDMLHKKIRSRMTVLWCHDMPSNADAMKSALWQTDRVFLLSQFQIDHYLKISPDLGSLIRKTANGVDLKAVSENIRPKVRGKIIHTSKPERGLEPLLLDIFPKLLEERPDLTLHLCTYNSPRDMVHPSHLEIMERCKELAAGFGDKIVDLGALTKAQLYQEISSSELMVYPLAWPEIFCISAIEAAACGTPIVTTYDYALKETVADGVSGHLIPGKPGEEKYNDLFIEACLHSLDRTKIDAAIETESSMGWLLDNGFTWKAIARDWNAQFEEFIADQSVKPSVGLRPRQTVACCIIAKNEEENIARCINSVKDHVDEVHVSVNGSTDNTANIARKCGAIVHNIAFDNFAQARNASIACAKTDWLLFMDCDEVLIGGDELRKYLDTPYFNGYGVRQQHLMIDAPGSFDTPIRLWRRKSEYKFVGYIHEHLEDVSGGKSNHPIKPPTLLPDVSLAHYGFSDEKKRRDKVQLRNMPLLRRAVVDEQSRDMTWICVMRDYMQMAKWELLDGRKIPRDSDYLLMLEEVVEIYLSKFDDESGNFYHMAYPLFQETLQIMCSLGLPGRGRVKPPFSVAFGLIGHNGQIPQENRLQGMVRWYVDEHQFRRFINGAADKMQKQLGLDNPVCPPSFRPDEAERLVSYGIKTDRIEERETEPAVAESA